ncbi:uncharacterized protein LOC120885346 [Ictidomys tridecemlineatus]
MRLPSATPKSEKSSLFPDCDPDSGAKPSPPAPRSLEAVRPPVLGHQTPESRRGRERTRWGRALPWRPRAPESRLPPPTPGSGPRSDSTAPAAPAQASPPGRSLQPATEGGVSCRPAPLTHGGGAVSGGGSLGPATSSLQPLGGRHRICNGPAAAHSAPGGGRTPGRPPREAAPGLRRGTTEPAARTGESPPRSAPVSTRPGREGRELDQSSGVGAGAGPRRGFSPRRLARAQIPGLNRG